MKTKARTFGGVEYEHDDGEVASFAAREMETLESERGILAAVIVRLERMLERSEEDQDQLRDRLDELYRGMNRTAGQLDGAERKIDELARKVEDEKAARASLKDIPEGLMRALKFHHEAERLDPAALCTICDQVFGSTETEERS
ncbi:MAG: hypothetical protein ACRDIX_07270 [Actinomycetota bacterium]